MHKQGAAHPCGRVLWWVVCLFGGGAWACRSVEVRGRAALWRVPSDSSSSVESSRASLQLITIVVTNIVASTTS